MKQDLSASFPDLLRQVVTDIYGPPKASHGYTEASIARGSHKKVAAEDLARLRSLLTPVGEGDIPEGWVDSMSAFRRPGVAACVFPPDKKSGGTRYALYVAARTGDEYRRFQQECGLNLSHF